MDGVRFQAMIDQITSEYIARLIEAGHVPANAYQDLLVDVTDVIDNYLQINQKDD